MSVRQGILALLSEVPMYGFQLRSEFERRTGGTWPLNVGQVYTTLSRLRRDGLVLTAGEPDTEGRIAYQLTGVGAGEVHDWWLSPVDSGDDSRDELVIKLALAISLADVDLKDIIRAQRSTTIQHLQDLTRLKKQAEAEDDLAWQLVVELDRSRARLSQRRTPHPAGPGQRRRCRSADRDTQRDRAGTQ
ncbi:MAG: PadR family transcriptional regulator [Aeromicrobium sp.]